MDAEKALIISDAFDVFDIARDLQDRIRAAYGMEITLEQAIEIIKVARIGQMTEYVSDLGNGTSRNVKEE